MLGSRREFSLFVNQLGKIAFGLTLYIDQSIYQSTSPYINSLYDWIRDMVSYLQNNHLPYYRPSPPPLPTTTYHYHPSISYIAIAHRYYQQAIARIGRQQRWATAVGDSGGRQRWAIAVGDSGGQQRWAIAAIGNNDRPPYFVKDLLCS